MGRPTSEPPQRRSRTSRRSSPRLGPGYLLYVSSKGASEGIWQLADGTTSELWTAPGARIVGGPAIAPDGQRIAFTVEQGGRTMLFVMNADGANARVVTESLALQGTPACAPDGQTIVSAVIDDGAHRLYRVPLDGRPPLRWLPAYAVDPVWDRILRGLLDLAARPGQRNLGCGSGGAS